MGQWGSEDVRNVYAGMTKKQRDKAGWLDPVLTAAGAIAGSILLPGVGTAAGASLGAGMGHAAGSVGHSLANGQVDPMQIGQAAMTIGSGYQAGQVPSTGISPQGSYAAQPQMPSANPSVPPDYEAILSAYRQNPGMFRQGFSYGGMVQPDAVGMVNQFSQMDPVQRAMLQAQQAAGPAPTAPTPQPLQQAQHPTLEALLTLLPQIAQALPRPAVAKNTKAIGAWAPAASLALSAPAVVAQARRAGANAPIEARNLSRQEQYTKDKAAHESRVTTLSNTLVGNATKPFAPDTPNAAESLVTPDEAKRMGHPEWAGMTRKDVSLRLQGTPTPVKPEGPPSPKDRAGIANMILDNVRQDKDVSNFVTVRDNYNRIARMARNGSGVGDMSLIFAYMKVLDPTSVVRESEYKNAADAIGKIPQLANLPANWMVGSKLTPVGRAGFVKAAKDLYETQRAAYRAAIEMHRGFAKEYGIDPRLILRNYESLDAGVPEVNATPAPGPKPPTAGTRIH